MNRIRLSLVIIVTSASVAVLVGFASGRATRATHVSNSTGAALQNAPSCNGWTFWHVEREGALVPLDSVRVTALAAVTGG